MNEEQLIEKKIEETGLSREELESKLEEAKSKAAEQYKDKTDTYREKASLRAFTKWTNRVRDLVTKTVDVIFKPSPEDIVARQREIALREFDNNPQKAIDENLTDRQGNPLWTGGQNKGEKMPEHLWIQRIFGVDEEGNLIEIDAGSDRIEDAEDLEGLTRVKTHLLDRTDPADPVPNYSLSKYSATEKIDEFDEEHAYDKVVNSQAYTPLDELRAETEAQEYDTHAIEAFLDWYEDEPPEDKSPRLTLKSADEEMNITAWLDNEFEVDTSTGSEVLVLGTTSLGQIYRDDMDKPPVQINNTYGLLPVPGASLEEGEEEIRL